MKKKFKKIYVEITNACNLSCTFCIKNQRKIKYLTKDEFYLPDVVDSMIKENMVQLIKTDETWMGMTYKEDLIEVQKRIKDLIEKGTYKNNLWEE